YRGSAPPRNQMNVHGVGAPARTRPGAGFLSTAAPAYWLALPLICLAVYWRGLFAWFQADDFAWLALRGHVHGWRSLLDNLFAPMAQGTIRPLSERAFFLVFESLFGVHALPFRMCVFLTQCANLILLAAVTRRITGSPAAGFWAAVLWLVNSGVALAMVWTSVYNQILCGFFLLSAFLFRLRYLENGRRRDLAGEWALFLLGFGALEINIVYPALAALYTYLFARRYLKTALPLFLPSAVFAVLHSVAAPAQSRGVYALHFDWAIPRTLATYCFRAFVPVEIYRFNGVPGIVLGCIFAAALIGFAVARLREKDWLPVFCLGWFVIVLAPVLPLRDHVSFYYLALPTIGLAMLGGQALASAWQRGGFYRVAGAAIAAAYLLVMIRADRMSVRWWFDRSQAVERMVLGVVRAHQLHPGQAILIDGVDSQLFWAGVFHHPFSIFGVSDVYLTPGSDQYIDALPGELPVSGYVLPGGPTVHGLNTNEIVVYRVGPKRLTAITSVYEDTAAQQLSPDPPRRIDLGNPLMAYLLGAEWYSLEDGGYRWMPRRATLRIGGPQSPSEKLYLDGFCSPAELQAGPLPVRITVDKLSLAEVILAPGNNRLRAELVLPNQLVGRKSIELSVESGRTFRTGRDDRELGLAFRSFEIR
ncbi:MAG: hypothetical protein JWO48_223, partial [Bryobacterales bacterium]|nr:hypothetical protein [Bryobacterales bacterium]